MATHLHALTLAALFALARGGTNLAATHDSIRWQGRTQRDEATGNVRYSWAGVSFHFTVEGATGASMEYSSTFDKGAAELRVYVDNKLANNITFANNASKTKVDLVTGLDASKHTISGIYITDPVTLSWNTLPNHAQTALGFLSDGTIQTQPPIDPAQRRFDIYGDSITAGNQINSDTCQPDWAGTYGKLLCEDFSANCTCAAISGKGIFHNCCDDDVTMNVLGLRLLPGDNTTTMNKVGLH
jgi:hypothetical protein